jgi:hypothetical protein
VTVSERLKALEDVIAHQDHGAPAAYGNWHSAVRSIRAEVEAVARETLAVSRYPGDMPTVDVFTRMDLKRLAARLAPEEGKEADRGYQAG